MGRKAWQEACVVNNFPNGIPADGPFLPPDYFTSDPYWKKEQALAGYTDAEIARRAEAVDGLNAELRTLLPKAHDMVHAGMLQAGLDGYLPVDAAQRAESAFALTAIQATDSSHMDGLASYEQEDDILLVTPAVQPYDTLLALIHELGGHKLSGGTFALNRHGRMMRTRRGLVSLSRDERGIARHTGLDEAVQHHLALSYTYRNMDTVDPRQRYDFNMQYADGRELLAAFILRAQGLIDLRDFTQASFEDSVFPSPTTTYRRNLARNASAAYGSGALLKLDVLYDYMDDQGLMAEDVVERLHGPRGHRPGSIDLEGIRPNNS